MSRSAQQEFSHFPRQTLSFLEALRDHNERSWFLDNKGDYERQVRAPAEQFSAAITEQLATLTGLPHQAKIFRIHRDVRFSRDKTPYNTHLHISFLPDTGGPPAAGWYFGLEPGKLTLGAGAFALDKPGLETFRDAVAGSSGTRLQELLDELARQQVRIGDAELKRVPPPWPADHANARLLRRKSLTGWIDFSDPLAACEPGFATLCGQTYGKFKPLFDWLQTTLR